MPHFLISTYNLESQRLLVSFIRVSGTDVHWIWKSGTVGCLIQLLIQTVHYSQVHVLTPENQHKANTHRSKHDINAVMEPACFY